MNVLMIVLRIIHIFSGVFWAGTSFFMLSYVVPTVAATGPEGQKFMQHLALRTRFTAGMLTVAVLSMLSGIGMYWRLFNFRLSVLSSGYGLLLTIGGLGGISAFVSGYLYQYRHTESMKKISAAIAASGGPPTEQQMAQMQAHSAKVSLGGQITTILLVVALLGMSIAQYVTF